MYFIYLLNFKYFFLKCEFANWSFGRNCAWKLSFSAVMKAFWNIFILYLFFLLFFMPYDDSSSIIKVINLHMFCLQRYECMNLKLLALKLEIQILSALKALYSKQLASDNVLRR